MKPDVTLWDYLRAYVSWDHLREYAHIYLLALAILMVAISYWKRRRRPDNDELFKLGKALAGATSALFVLAFLVIHKNSELGGMAIVLMCGIIPYAWSSFVALSDVTTTLWKKDAQEPPEEFEPVPPRANARIEADPEVEVNTETEADVEAEAENASAQTSASRKASGE
jgi:hypothetical protein